ncbi:MAG: transketolase [Candidatus Roizmanbacteria bacterium]
MNNTSTTQKLAKLLRYYSLVSTTEAGSGHPTSCLSAADLMAVLMYEGYFRYDIDHKDNIWNDRLIFSKGHAAPLFYALWAVGGVYPKDDLMKLRQFGSEVEGHPTMKFPYTEMPTGSLGQGLSVGLGMALHAKLFTHTDSRTYVLIGDSEMAEGSNWEAMQLASHYHSDNLIAILDANRLGQRGETMYGHDLKSYEDKATAFGWWPIIIDGHDLDQIRGAYKLAHTVKDKPVMIICKTYKGYGVASLQDKEGKHGTVVKREDLPAVLFELGEVDTSLVGKISKPSKIESVKKFINEYEPPTYKLGEQVATREAYGAALAAVAQSNPSIIALDAETSNSTFADGVKKVAPDQFLEMYIAEQNMISAATGLALRDMVPFTSSFAAFLTRGYDQIRMAGVAGSNLKIVGSHAGVSIGEDGGSQMALEDIAMMRSIWGSAVFYPSDAQSTTQLVEYMAHTKGLMYMRTTRAKTPVIYGPDEVFTLGGSKVHGDPDGTKDAVLIAAGITLHEALKAQKALLSQGKRVAVIDLYSVKPVDEKTINAACDGSKKIIVIEDHYAEGGMANAVQSVLRNRKSEFISLAVRRLPCSGKPVELLEYEEIDAAAIIRAVETG